MSDFQLKIYALIMMILDHVMIVFFRDTPYINLSPIFRFSWMIFPWMIAKGAIYTKNIKGYMRNLLIFAIISEVPYYIIFEGYLNFGQRNIIFTLFLGLLSIYILQKYTSKILKSLLVFLIVFSAIMLSIEAAFDGILTIVIFYKCFGNVKKIFLYQSILYVSCFLIFAYPYILNNRLYEIPFMKYSYLFAIIGSFIPCIYNNKRGFNKGKIWFYSLYPAHLIIIAIILYIQRGGLY